MRLMDDFLPSGIAYVAKVALWFGGVMVFVIALDGLRRWRKGDAPFTAATMQQVIEEHAFFLFIMVTILTMDTGNGWADFFTILPFVALLLGASFLIKWRRVNKAKANAVDNPDAVAGHVAAPVKMSAEERRVTFKISVYSLIAPRFPSALSWWAISAPGRLARAG